MRRVSSQSPLAHPERRRFMQVAKAHGFTTAVLLASKGLLWSDQAVAQTAADEAARQKAASVSMILATEYKLGSYKGYPIMQEAFKENLQNATKGALCVRLHPAGQLGAGPALAQKVQAGTVHAAAVSLSNFSPFAPVVDVINIPFWCGDSQRFSNLTSSSVWNKEITPKVNARGYKPVFYYSVGPRTISRVRNSRTGPEIFRMPADLTGVKVRVPASEMLAQIYRLAGGTPTAIAWGETPAALKQGVADAIDISIGGFWAFGFMDIMGSVTLLSQVPDGQMFAANLAWFNSLPKSMQAQFDEAGELTLRQTWEQLPKALGQARSEMTALGAKFHLPTAAETQAWIEACGEQRPEWVPFKIKLAESTARFDELKAAANTAGKYKVVDYL